MNQLEKKLTDTVYKVKGIRDIDFKESIFSGKYGFTPADIIYIFVLLQREYKFNLSEKFVDGLRYNSTFEDIIRYIYSEVY